MNPRVRPPNDVDIVRPFSRVGALIAAAACACTAAGQSLVQLDITGPAEVVGGDAAYYAVSALYDNDMFFEVVLCADLSVDSGEFAQLDRFGQLTTTEVDSDRTVTLRASFTDGITLDAELDVTVIAASPLDCDFPSYLRSRTVGGLGPDSAHGFATDGRGNTWLVGSYTGVVDFDPGAGEDLHEAVGAEDVFVTLFDSQGSYCWTRTFGGAASDEGRGIAVDDQANVIVTGSFESTVDFDPGPGIDPRSSRGESDVFAVKLDADGSHVWSRTIGGILADSATDVAIDGQGGVLLTGSFQHQVDFDPTSGEDLRAARGGQDIFTVKLGGDGSYCWAYAVGGLQADEAFGVAVVATGEVVTAGRFRRSIDFDPGEGEDVHQAAGGTDAFVTCLGPDGAYQWTRAFGGVSTDGAYDVAITALGEAVVTGYYWETVDFDPGAGVDEHTSNGQSDVFVTRLRSDGSYRWTGTIGGLESDEGQAVSVDPTGNVLVAGLFRGTVDFDPETGLDERASNGGSDAFVLKLGAGGTYEWAATTGGDSNDAARALAADGQGLIMLAGSFEGTIDLDPTDGGVDEHVSSGATDAFVSVLQCGQLDGDDDDCPSPDFAWARSMGGAGADTAYRVATDSRGGWWVTGSFEGIVDFDPGDDVDLHLAMGQQDVFVTRIHADGSYGWTRTFGGPGADIGLGVGIDAYGSAFVTGHFELGVDFDPGPGFDPRASNGGTDVFVVKLDGEGTELWARSFGGTEDDEGVELAVDAWGDVAVCGSFRHQVDFDPTGREDIHSSHGDSDIFIAKLRADGSYGWAYTVGGLQADEGLALTVDRDGNVFGAGRFRRLVDFDPGPGEDSHLASGGTDVFVTSLAADGSFAWARTFGGISTDGAHDLSVGNAGELSVTGYYWETVDFDPTEGVDEHTSLGQSDIFVTRLGTDGSYRWTRTVGSPLTEEGLAACVDDSGDTFVTGRFRGTVDFDPTEEVDEQTSVGGDDVFLLRLRSDGSYGWTATVGGEDLDFGQTVACDAYGRILLAGSFSESADFDPGDGVDEHVSAGAADTFVLALQCQSCWPATKPPAEPHSDR